MQKFQIYEDNKGEFRWKLRAANNRAIADSAEGYKNKRDCLLGIQLVRRLSQTAEIKDET
jgi:uncharacterized protein YegP (UPF0339 family)